MIIWDGASYHRSQQIKDYLDSLNREKERAQWLITCERFTPNDQTPFSPDFVQLTISVLFLHSYLFLLQMNILIIRF